MGNSWLGSAQWFIAAERPPHLACILPLEGNSDSYRETLARGGVPAEAFWIWIRDLLLGTTKTEDVASMLKKYPLMNAYWEAKRAKMEDIQVPAYILASMSSQLHTEGSFRGFEEIAHDNKWCVFDITSHAAQLCLGVQRNVGNYQEQASIRFQDPTN